MSAQLDRQQFIGWIADRFIERHVPPFPRERALEMAEACLSFAEETTGPLGHPDFDWSESGARDVADEEIRHWEG